MRELIINIRKFFTGEQDLLDAERILKKRSAETNDPALRRAAELQRRYKAALEANDGSEEDIDSSMIPAFVTLIVSDDQAYDLVQQEKYNNGTVHLVLHPTETYTSDGVVGKDGKVIERIVNRADLPDEDPEEEPEENPEDIPENGSEQGNTPAPAGGGVLPTGGFIE